MKEDWANLKKYELENKKLSSSIKTNRIVFIGDSITEFWKIHDPTFFNEIQINRGISGQTTSEIVHRFYKDVLDLKPKIVIILAGINDIAENIGPISNEDIINNINSMVNLAKENTIKVFLCSLLPANRFSWNTKITPADRVIALNKMLSNFALKNNCVYVDYYSKMVDNENGLQEKYGKDGVHPNKEGYAVMKKVISEIIETTNLI